LKSRVADGYVAAEKGRDVDEQENYFCETSETETAAAAASHQQQHYHQQAAVTRSIL
jgi:hypothetical protein